MPTSDTNGPSRDSAKLLEAEDTRRQFFPRRNLISSHADFLARASEPAGRYRSPKGAVEQLHREFEKYLAEFGGEDVRPSYIFENPLYPVPPAWQAVFDYLYAEGVISSRFVSFERLFHDEPKIYSLRLFSVFGKEATDGRAPSTPGHSRGVSPDFEEALSKVTGEFLERYPLTLYKQEEFVRASVNDLRKYKKSFLNIHALAGFADWQKEPPGRRFDDTSLFHWVPGVELLSNTKALIPAQLVFWNYDVRREPVEPYLRQPITNGAAGHFTRTEAILAGIYENIQRDAFLIRWLRGMPPPRIAHASLRDETLKKTIAEFERYGFEVILLDTTLDCEVPSCTCVLIDTTGRGPAVSLGGGCGSDLERALMRGIAEAHGVCHWLRTQPYGTVQLRADYKPFRDPLIQQDARLLLWGHESMLQHIQPFISGKEVPVSHADSKYPREFASPEAELERVLATLRAKGEGYEVYVYEAQHRILKTLGYASVRVVIPALLPLYLNEMDAPVGSSRLSSVPSAFGHSSESELTPWPHPFP